MQKGEVIMLPLIDMVQPRTPHEYGTCCQEMVVEKSIENIGIMTSWDSPYGFVLFSESKDNSGETQQRSEEVPLQEYTVEEITVTGKRPEQALEPVTMVSYTIEGQAIETMKPSSLADVLNSIISLRASTGSKNETTIMMRGLSPANYIILMDGEPILYSPYDRKLDFQQIPADNISKIVISPNAPSLYGPNTMGGAINIITKKGSGAPTFKVRSEISDNDTKQINYNFGIEKRGIQFFSSAEFRDSDGFDLPDGTKRQNVDYRGKNISFKLGKSEQAYNISLLTSFIRNDDKGLPVSLNPDDRPRYWRFKYWNKDMIGLSGQYNFSGNIFLRGRLFHEHFENRLNAFRDREFKTRDFASTFDDNVYGSSLELHLHPGIHNFVVSTGFRRDEHNDQSDAGEPWYTSQEYIYSASFYDISRYGNLIINTGASMDFQDMSKAENVSVKNDAIRAANPELGLAYVLGNYKIRTNVNRKTNFPSLQQLTSSTSGNPDLNPEKGIKFEAGIDYEKDVRLSLSFFMNHIKDRIDRINRNDPYENINKGKIRGIEVTAMRKIMPGDMQFHAGYTYLSAVDQRIADFERPMQYVPDHNVRLWLTRQFFRNRLTGTVMVDIVSKLPYPDRSNNTKYLDPYQDMGIILSYSPISAIQVYVKTINLFNQNIVEEAGFPRCGRRFFMGAVIGK